MPAHRPQEHRDGEVLDVVVHTSIVHGCRLRTVVTIRPSRGRVSSCARRRAMPRRCAPTATRLRALTAPPLSSRHGIYVMAGEETAWSVQMLQFDAVFARAYSVGISSVSHDTPSASHPVHEERVSDPRPQGTIQRQTKRSSERCSSTAGARMTDPGLRNGFVIGSQCRSSPGPASTESTGPSAVRDTRRQSRRGPRGLVLAVVDRDHRRGR
jgi:hypothetical protein